MAYADELDTRLRQLLSDNNVGPLAQTTARDDAMVDLGRSLFFDRELSGNRNIACASCHHPSAATGDSRSLPSGTGGEGIGPDRTQAEGREIVPRNSPDVFDRGDPQWTSMFWDSRVSGNVQQFNSPAGDKLPGELRNVMAVQAMFPVTSRTEMRGKAGDVDVFGQVNELAQFADGDFQGIWSAIMSRLERIPAYRDAFEKAYPDVARDDLEFQHAANAISAFEESAFSPRDSKWDRYLAGENDALTEAAKRGASHFFSGGCASCHSGNLMTDQEHHNLGVPQLGPGKDPASGLDPGRFLQTADDADEFAFRTPPLRNVALTGPWMHNGAFSTLEEAIRHHLAPTDSLTNYDVSQLDDALRSTVRLDQETIDRLVQSLDPLLPNGEPFTEQDIGDVMAFLASLTSPSADEMLSVTPAEVFSGLEVDRLPPSPITVAYDPQDGGLELLAEDELFLDAVFLRISDGADGEPAGFAFQTGAAPWLDDSDIVLSNDSDAQSFLDYRADPMFLVKSGDTLEQMLPAGLSARSISDHVSAAVRIHGAPVLWTANIVTVPEPESMILLGLGILLVVCRRRRNSTVRD